MGYVPVPIGTAHSVSMNGEREVRSLPFTMLGGLARVAQERSLKAMLVEAPGFPSAPFDQLLEGGSPIGDRRGWRRSHD